MTSDTYEMSEKGVLSCYECGKDTGAAFEVELRHCIHCGFWHVEHLKPSWAKDDMHEAIVEAAMDLADAKEGGKYGPMESQIKVEQEGLDKACAELAAERGDQSL